MVFDQIQKDEIPQDFLVNQNFEVVSNLLLAQDDQETMLCFFDNSPKHPSQLLNNILHKYQNQFRNLNSEADSMVLKIILIKDKISKISEAVTLDGSFYAEVVLTQA